MIISIDVVTGERKLVSDNTRGTGDDLVAPASLSMGADHILYVADNSSSKILAVDTATGNRSALASSLTGAYGINKPSHLVADTQAKNRLFVLANASNNYILQLNLAATPVTSSLVSDSGNSLQGSTRLYTAPKGIALAASLNSLFVADSISDLVKVDIATGNRTEFLETEGRYSPIGYDTQKQLLYLVDGIFPGLFVVDPVTAQKVLISRD